MRFCMYLDQQLIASITYKMQQKDAEGYNFYLRNKLRSRYAYLIAAARSQPEFFIEGVPSRANEVIPYIRVDAWLCVR